MPFIEEIWLWLFKSSRNELCFCIKQSPWMTACNKSCIAKLQCEFSKPAVAWFHLAKLVSTLQRMLLLFSRQTPGPWLSSLSHCAKDGPLRKLCTLKYLSVPSYWGRQHAFSLLCCKNTTLASSNTTFSLFHLGLEKGKRVVIVLRSRTPLRSWWRSRPGAGCNQSATESPNLEQCEDKPVQSSWPRRHFSSCCHSWRK